MTDSSTNTRLYFPCPPWPTLHSRADNGLYSARRSTRRRIHYPNRLRCRQTRILPAPMHHRNERYHHQRTQHHHPHVHSHAHYTITLRIQIPSLRPQLQPQCPYIPLLYTLLSRSASSISHSASVDNRPCNARPSSDTPDAPPALPLSRAASMERERVWTVVNMVVACVAHAPSVSIFARLRVDLNTNNLPFRPSITKNGYSSIP